MRLIDADILKETKWDRKNGNPHFLNGVDTVMEMIDNLPTVEPRPTAHWIKEDATFKCSNCGFEIPQVECRNGRNRTVNYKHCPECTAVMEVNND